MLKGGQRLRLCCALLCGQAQARALFDLAERIILAFMEDVRTQLSPSAKGRDLAREDTWPNRHVSYVGKFTSEKDAIDWINAHPNLTKPVDTVDAPPLAGD